MRVLWPTLLLTFAAGGLCLESNLVTRAELRTRIPMTLLTDFAKFPVLVRTPDFVLASSDVESLFTLIGQDKRGRHWRVILRDAARGAWQSAGPPETYYFAGYTGAAGNGPATWILGLTLDADGLPVPFFSMTHGGYDPNGIEDVLNLDGHGPEFLEQSYWGNIRDDPGYYVTVLYQQRGAYWYRSDGRHGAHIFPAFEKWSVMWKDRPAELVSRPPPGHRIPDSGNDPARGVRTKVLSAEGNAVRVGREVGCEAVRVELLVSETRVGRRIDLEPTTQQLDELAKAHRSVVLTGLYRWPDSRECDASILWANAAR